MVKIKLYRKTTDLEKWQIKQFIRRGGKPSLYTLPTGLNLDNVVKNKWTFTVTPEQKDTINEFMYGLPNTTSATDTTDTLTISKNSIFYKSLKILAHYIFEDIDNLDNWDFTNEYFIERIIIAQKNNKEMNKVFERERAANDNR